MLLHLDSYDLINVFKNKPVGSDGLRHYLVERRTTLVYSAETIQEVVRPNDVDESSSRLKALTTFPHCYIREKKEIFRREFACAISAFQGNTTYKLEDVEPFSSTWQEVDPPLSSKYGVTEDCLVEIVVPLLKAEPDRFRNTQEQLDALMANVAVDRTLGNNLRQRSFEIFRDAVGASLIQLGLHPPHESKDLVDGLAAWLYKNPSVCPSWRLMGETYSEFANNIGDKGQLGDPPDFAHVSVVPYVDAITLDARMSDYVKTAARRLAEIDNSLDYDKRIFRNLSTWIESVI